MAERQRLDIPYTGYAATPSDYDCADGELATAMNMVLEDGSLRPVLPAGRVTKPYVNGDGGGKIPVKVIFCHKNDGWVHYIGLYEEDSKTGYCWLDYPANEDDETVNAWGWPGAWSRIWKMKANGYEHDGALLFGEAHRSITAIGNMLIVSTDKSVHYLLYQDKEWTSDDGKAGYSFRGYKYMGTSVPKIQMEFALDGELYFQTNADTGMEYGKNKNTAANEWKTVYVEENVSWDYKKTEGYLYKATVSLKKDYEYCFRFKNDIEHGGSRAYYLYGITASGEQEYIGGPRFHRSINSDSVFTMKSDYVGIVVTGCMGDVGKVVNDTYYIDMGSKSYSEDDTVLVYNEDNYTAVMGYYNRFINKYATARNRFIHPFFVRYATRLYSGDLINISAPILMRPNTGYAPLTEWNKTDSADFFRLYAFIADLQARATEEVPDEWSDIIQGVDIFVSQPLYPYSQGEEYDASEMKFTYYSIADWNDLANSIYDSAGVLKCNYNGTTLTADRYSRLTMSAALQSAGIDDGVSKNFIRIAERDVSEDNVLALSATCYKLVSLDLRDVNKLVADREHDSLGGVTGSFTMLDIKDGVLENLATQEVLADDTLSARTFAGACLYSYNKRLHVYGGEYHLPQPTPIDEQNGVYTEGVVRTAGEDISSAVDYAPIETIVAISTTEGVRYVKVDRVAGDGSVLRLVQGMLCDVWFYYPDSRATDVYIRMNRYGYDAASGTVRTDGTYLIHFELSAHPYLGGAYWYSGGLDTLTGYTIREDTMANLPGGDTCPTGTNIYVSEVNNPFAFKSGDAVSIDCARIIGMASAAKAMSTGQFGQFPLYCFTDNGVWSLELTSTGTYKSTQPVTRDVCLSAESITQLDGSVLFATKRGIMEVSGSTSACISDTLKAEDMFVPMMLPAMEAVLLAVGDDDAKAWMEAVTMKPFVKFCAGCRMIYDYVRQRIIVYNPECAYAYVFSLKSKTWGMMQSDLSSHFGSYPDALAMDADGYLVDFGSTTSITGDEDGSTEDITGVDGLVVTRPLKFGLRDTHKTVFDLLQRGLFVRGHVGQVLYGSNDLRSWHIINTSRDQYLRCRMGTPYKYFRVVLACHLLTDESVSGLSVEFLPRLQNRLR